METTIHIFNDERRIEWQEKLIAAIDEQNVFDRVRKFYLELIDDEIKRVDDGEPCRGDLSRLLVFPKSTPELREAADQAFALGLGTVIDKLLVKIIAEHQLDEQGWFDQIDRDQFRSVVYEVVLREYVVGNPDFIQ
ncbi:hypothetical protein N9D23_00590 [Rubripirellula sp.]|nr:hypothetical protein [Rubripirellula sp.]